MLIQRFLSSLVSVSFLLTSLGPLPQASADEPLSLPVPGTMVNLTAAFEPALIKGITVDKDNPFRFNFIMDAGKSGLSGEALKKEGDLLVKYFFACLTIPEKDLWVNLSPYEKERIIPQALGQTPLGRDLLAQDYILKQLTASLIYPEKDLGKEFWNGVYAKARQLYGTSQIPVNTFNKVWILADKATVYEHGQTALVLDGHLKVMLDEDYLALKKHSVIATLPTGHSAASQVVRTIILPAIEKEVNTGKNFATLRQIFNSLILASWYKKNLKEALLNQVYADKSTVQGVSLADPSVKERIYQQYLQAYKKGVFNYIKEDSDPYTKETLPHKYFSGGFGVNPAMLTVTRDRALLGQVASTLGASTSLFNLDVSLSLNQPDKAMSAKRPDIKRIGVLTGGGLATGHNSLITAALREAEAQGPDVEILGVPNGWAGLTRSDLKDQIRRLTVKEMERFENQGGSVIKSSRTNPVKVSDEEINKELIRLGHVDPDTVPAAVREGTRLALVKKKVETLISTLKELNIDGLIVMGGDDTNGVSSIIHAFAPDFPILGVPKTMDNDVYLPEGVPTYGYDSFVAAAANSLRYDMRSAIDQDRIFVVETFGRDSGFTTIGAGARVGATLTLIPEQKELNIDQVVEQVRAFYLKNHYALIVLSEGVKFEQTNAGGVVERDQFGHTKLKGGGDALAKILKERLKDIIDPKDITNAAKLDYATREAPISLEDRMITQALGREAVRLLRDGVTGKILYTDRNYNVKAMSFPDEQGVVTYVDDTGVAKTMNISQLRGDKPDVSTDARRKIGGRVAHVEEGGVDYDAYVAANQAIFGEQSLIMKIELELNRIDKEMTFDIAKMSHLLNLSSELKQLEFDIHEFSEELTQVESEITHLKQTSAKGRLLQRAAAIKTELSELIKIKATHISAGKTDAAMGSNKIVTVRADNAFPGGIDLNTSGMSTTLHKEGAGVEMTFDAAMVARIRKDGIQSLTPVIFKITPITDIKNYFIF